MIDHVGFEVTDVGRAARFYDAVFFALGVRRMHQSERAVAYGVTAPTFWLTARNHVHATVLGTTPPTSAIQTGSGSRSSPAADPEPHRTPAAR
jgi:hypothetical protein